MDADITAILLEHRGDTVALSRRLIPAVYQSLKRMAVDQMRREARQVTLQPTALVHEAYLRLVGGDPDWENRRHFFGAAAEAMRRILIEQARRRRRLKRGGDLARADVPLDELPGAARRERLLDLDEALARLEAVAARKALVVKLRYFLGLSIEETADVLGVSPTTVKLDWSFARAWLWRELGPGAEPGV